MRQREVTDGKHLRESIYASKRTSQEKTVEFIRIVRLTHRLSNGHFSQIKSLKTRHK